MEKQIQILDCTLRDGAYIVNGKFGVSSIKGIIKKTQDANIDIIECGWLKNGEYEEGSTFFHVPDDVIPYLPEKNNHTTYVAMIDWDQYDLHYLPDCDGRSLEAIRIVFPYGKYKEGIQVGKIIREKGYKVYYQMANTLAYSDMELKNLAIEMNQVNPESISIVDTFGAMYEEDLERIIDILNKYLNKNIKMGFHSHNNQQLSFALTMFFVKKIASGERKIVVDSSLCGMGRGAGNATTELVANYLNSKYFCNYDMDVIMDAIDIYMSYFCQNYNWGYSIPYFIAGMYCCHVNNIAYLTQNHRTNARDMRNIIGAMDEKERRQYNYDLLEKKYIENQNQLVNDELALEFIKRKLKNRKVLLIAPGKSIIQQRQKVTEYIEQYKPVVFAVNALIAEYDYDYFFITNSARYDYAKEVYSEQFENTPKIVLSNIKTKSDYKEYIINFNRVIKRGWEHFDNAVICCLRLMDKLRVHDVAIAGFDGFKTKYNESYADEMLPTLNPNGRWEKLNEEIKDMYTDFYTTTKDYIKISFITDSIFNNCWEKDGKD